MTRQQLKSLSWFLGVIFLSITTLLTLSHSIATLDIEQLGRALDQEASIESKNIASPVLPNAANTMEEALVTKVIDGDTIEVQSGQKVRYIGIDTPELHHPQKGVECYGKEAAAANTAFVLGKKVRLQRDVSETDRYGRLLRYVWLEDKLVNETLVEQGYARAVAYPPDTLYQKKFAALQLDAVSKKLGAWTACPKFGK